MCRLAGVALPNSGESADEGHVQDEAQSCIPVTHQGTHSTPRSIMVATISLLDPVVGCPGVVHGCSTMKEAWVISRLPDEQSLTP